MIKLCSDAFYYILISIVVIGFIQMIFKQSKWYNPKLFIIVLFYLGTIALHIFFEAASRYHNPCFVLLCILAAYCVETEEPLRYARQEGNVVFNKK